VRLLLDSHTALWALQEDERLGRRSTSMLVDPGHQVFFSAVTPWELNIKRASGKLDVPEAMGATLVADGFTELAITSDHAERAAALPLHHRDPFDRMLIAQAQLERLTIITVDRVFAHYDVDLIDASI